MCGLAAMVELRGGQADRVIVEAMARTLVHRGPDDSGVYVSGPVAFGFRRLAILDLAPTGHQPMLSGDGELVLVFNGEIYNYLELREELQALGHTFTSSGDTQVLLAAYRQWREQCLPKLNGMWAFLIYDVRAGKVVGSRDRFGVKPLYRYRSGDRVFFASEIKAIRACGHYRGAPNWPLVSRFLRDARLEVIDTGTETFYAGIEQVPAGTMFELSLDGQFTERRFWSLGSVPAAATSDPPRVFRELFGDAVRLRMRSDVPLGVSLSGGLDSTSIISFMAWLRANNIPAVPDGPLLAFSYVAPEFDESPYIAETLEQTGALFHEIPSDPVRFWDRLDRLLWYQDEPVHSLNAMIVFEILELAAAKGVKVMLNGGGADEHMGGYFSYFSCYWYTLLATGRVREAWDEIGAYCRTHGGDRRSLFGTAVRQLCRSSLAGLPGHRALARWRRRPATTATWVTPDLAEPLLQEPEALALDDSLRESVERAPLPYYLRLDDRNSMAHSVEVRSPFLDYRLVSLLFGLPPKWKIRGAWNKYLLREAMRGHIPEAVRTRPDKMGFPLPERNWVAGPLYGPLQDLLASETVRSRGFYNVPLIRQDLERHRAGEIDVSKPLLAIAQLESWFNLVSNGDGLRGPSAGAPPDPAA